MWNPLNIWREERKRDRDAMIHMMEKVCEVAIQTSIASRAQADALKQYFLSYQTDGMPESRVMRDEDEWLAERQQLKAAGFPVDVPSEEQLKYIMANMVE